MTPALTVDVDAGEVGFDESGVTFEPLRGDTRTWPWTDVEHVAFDEGETRADPGAFLSRGLIGVVAGRRRSQVVLSVAGEDLALPLGADISLVRAFARRVATIPAASGKVSVAGRPV